jgi:peroxiredoxin
MLLLVRMALAAIAVPAAPGFAPVPDTAPSAKKVVVGQPAPEFTLKTFAREEISLSSMRGQVVVLNLWATWCVPCRREMPMMDSYFRRNRSRGLRIFAVATEDSVPPFRLKAVSDALAFPLVLRLRGAQYQPLDGVPTNYIIDRRGIVRYAASGAFDHAEFDAILKPLLDEAPPPAP